MNQVETIISAQIDNRNRTTVFWRPILAFPMIIFISSFFELAHWGWGLAGITTVPVLLALVVRGIYPSYALQFNHALMELQLRLVSYLLLLTDEFPSIEANPKFAVIFPDIEGGKKLDRFLPLVKWLLVIPHVILGIFYTIAAHICTLYAWFYILIKGVYPQSSVDFVTKVIAFWYRVFGYATTLVTDEYPPFSITKA